MRPSHVLIATMLAASPALAFDTGKLGQGGSLPLSDINDLIGRSAKLQQEVKAALAETKKTADEIICGGTRFPSRWVHLGGMRAAPYACNFATKWLVINAAVTIAGPKGQVFETATPAAMRNAVKVIETNPAWKWTTEEPD